MEEVVHLADVPDEDVPHGDGNSLHIKVRHSWMEKLGQKKLISDWINIVATSLLIILKFLLRLETQHIYFTIT